jgi:LemA protein
MVNLPHMSISRIGRFGSIAAFSLLLTTAGLVLPASGCGYNGLVESDEAVKASWAQVENVYQRRSDLIPNLVATVKGSAQHEEKVLTEVAEARASATQVKLSADDLNNPEKMKAFEDAQSKLSSSLGRLLMVSENYPDLKANAAFRDLQVQLEGTENRITVERKRYNDAVQAYNVKVRSFPTMVVAKFTGFKPKEVFKATTANADKAPEVKF